MQQTYCLRMALSANAITDVVLETVTNWYLSSDDFNGLLATTLTEEFGDDGRESLRGLIESGKVTMVYGDRYSNPAILALEPEPVSELVRKLNTPAFERAYVYPGPAHLTNVVDRSKYAGKPFTLELALGAPQLSFRAFDLMVLEHYRNDPRYYYDNDEVRGWISVHDGYYKSPQMKESDQVLLQTFGFCYNDRKDRAVAVFVRYLSDLSPEHQQIWKARELQGDWQLHPDYYRNSILGEFGTRITITAAFMEEMKIINQMSAAMGRPPFFRDDFAGKKPRGFGFLVRPTLRDFNQFVLLLDQLLSDNINKDFFQGEVPDEIETPRKDGKIVVGPKGTLTMLKEWLQLRIRTPDPQPRDAIIQTFRKIRSLRQVPAHAVDQDAFDQKYFHEQRRLLIDAYAAVRTLRLLFANHPGVQAAKIEINDHLFEGKIWTF